MRIDFGRFCLRGADIYRLLSMSVDARADRLHCYPAADGFVRWTCENSIPRPSKFPQCSVTIIVGEVVPPVAPHVEDLGHHLEGIESPVFALKSSFIAVYSLVYGGGRCFLIRSGLDVAYIPAPRFSYIPSPHPLSASLRTIMLALIP
ncbi:hypothetical protein C8J56DRAFT_1041939 [Mycena floridula]|nr:hypothetical protein C8J56DRAFT_1041939 [Mycena floridula]